MTQKWKQILFIVALFIHFTYYVSALNATEACYPGARNDNSVCFGTRPISQIQDPNGDYKYKDPMTDSTFPRSFNPAHYHAPARIIDLSSVHTNPNLSPHFGLSEIMPNRHGRYSLYSAPVLRIIEEMRDEIRSPIIVNSSYRSPGFNASLGSVAAAWSRHTYGDAIDFYAPGFTFGKLRDVCLRLGASFFQIYAHHIHCDWRANAPDPSFFDIDSGWSLTDSREVLVAFNEYYNKRTMIHHAIEKSGAGDLLVFSSETPYKEDAGSLIYEWSIHTPYGLIHEFGENPRIPFVRGRYLVSVTIGGSLTISPRRFDIN